jgi:two-component system, NarL family, response regulator DevR
LLPRLIGKESIMPKVLIVDNDDHFRKHLCALLNHGDGFDGFLEGGNAVEALDYLKRESPCLAILDSSLPDMSGLQLAQEVHTIAPQLPVFLVMNNYSMDTERKALSCGVTAVFSKLDDLGMLVTNARVLCGVE